MALKHHRPIIESYIHTSLPVWNLTANKTMPRYCHIQYNCILLKLLLNPLVNSILPEQNIFSIPFRNRTVNPCSVVSFSMKIELSSLKSSHTLINNASMNVLGFVYFVAALVLDCSY